DRQVVADTACDLHQRCRFASAPPETRQRVRFVGVDRGSYMVIERGCGTGPLRRELFKKVGYPMMEGRIPDFIAIGWNNPRCTERRCTVREVSHLRGLEVSDLWII